VPGMLARGGGRIVNVSSYAAVRPSPYHVPYACAKAALLSLTEALAASLAPYGVTAFAVTPGYIDTELTRHLRDSTAGRGWLRELAGRAPREPERGARLVAALACGKADALTGRFLHALDDLDEIVARVDEVEREEYYLARLRRLPAARTP